MHVGYTSCAKPLENLTMFDFLINFSVKQFRSYTEWLSLFKFGLIFLRKPILMIFLLKASVISSFQSEAKIYEIKAWLASPTDSSN